MTKKVELYLSGRYSNLFTLVDDDDLWRLTKYKWYVDGRGYIVSSSRKLKLHRYIMRVDNPKIQVDHIDGNKLNNSKENLRLVSNKDNQRNLHKNKGKSSNYFGVTLDKRENLTKRWIANIKVNGKNIFLGRFLTEKEAANAYNLASNKYNFRTFNIL